MTKARGAPVNQPQDQLTTEAGPATAIYLYGFAPAAAAGLPPAMPAVDDGTLTVHRHADVAALVSAVPRASYEGERGEAHLADIGWVGPRALRHQAVLDAAKQTTTIVPLPFATLFSSIAALDAEMVRRGDTIRALLRRLTGCSEWALQARLDHAAALDAQVRGAIADGRFVPPAAAGRRHLEEQRLRRALARETQTWVARRVAALAAALQEHCRDFVERRLPVGQGLALNWALLVPDVNATRLNETIAAHTPALAADGLHLTCKGPWPGYSFSSLSS